MSFYQNGEVPVLKIILVGPMAVGKTCLVSRIVDHSFPANTVSNIMATFFSHKFQFANGVRAKAEFWDTAGMERFRSLNPMYFRGAHVAIVCYDITSHDTFQEMKICVDEVFSYASEAIIVICGLKSDLCHLRKISSQSGENYAKGIGAMFFEVSSLTGNNVDFMFQEITEITWKAIQTARIKLRQEEVGRLRLISSHTESGKWYQKYSCSKC